MFEGHFKLVLYRLFEKAYTFAISVSVVGPKNDHFGDGMTCTIAHLQYNFLVSSNLIFGKTFNFFADGNQILWL